MVILADAWFAVRSLVHALTYYTIFLLLFDQDIVLPIEIYNKLETNVIQ